MSPDEVLMVQRSFAAMAKGKARAGEIFYDRLFEVAPELRSMFRSDRVNQAAKLVDTLGLCISQLSHPQLVGLTLEGLGQRHLAYGVKPEHYAVVGEVLLWTLRQCLGSQFTPAVEAAWTALYVKASEAMISASFGHPRQRPSYEMMPHRKAS